MRHHIDCLQCMPYQCRYCVHFVVEDIYKPCTLCHTKDSWKEVQVYNHCRAFKPRTDRCEVCSLRIKCVTGA